MKSAVVCFLVAMAYVAHCDETTTENLVNTTDKKKCNPEECNTYCMTHFDTPGVCLIDVCQCWPPPPSINVCLSQYAVLCIVIGKLCGADNVTQCVQTDCQDSCAKAGLKGGRCEDDGCCCSTNEQEQPKGVSLSCVRLPGDGGDKDNATVTGNENGCHLENCNQFCLTGEYGGGQCTETGCLCYKKEFKKRFLGGLMSLLPTLITTGADTAVKLTDIFVNRKT